MSNLQQILQGCDTYCCLLVFVSVGQHFSMPRRSHYHRFIVIVSCSNEMCCRKREHMKRVHVQTRRRSQTPNHIYQICLKVFAFPCELKRHTKTHEPGRGTRCKHVIVATPQNEAAHHRDVQDSSLRSRSPVRRSPPTKIRSRIKDSMNIPFCRDRVTNMRLLRVCVCPVCVCSTYDPSYRFDDLVWSSTWKPSST